MQAELAGSWCRSTSQMTEGQILLQTLMEQQPAAPKAEQATHLPLESVNVGRTGSLNTWRARKMLNPNPCDTVGFVGFLDYAVRHRMKKKFLGRWTSVELEVVEQWPCPVFMLPWLWDEVNWAALPEVNECVLGLCAPGVMCGCCLCLDRRAHHWLHSDAVQAFMLK